MASFSSLPYFALHERFYYFRFFLFPGGSRLAFLYL